MLVCWWQWFDWSFARPKVPVVTVVISIITSLHFPDGAGLAGTRISPFWILLELRVIEIVVTIGAIKRRVKLQSKCHQNQHPEVQFFYRPDALPVVQPTVSCPWFWIFIYRNGHVKILWLIDWLSVKASLDCSKIQDGLKSWNWLTRVFNRFGILAIKTSVWQADTWMNMQRNSNRINCPSLLMAVLTSAVLRQWACRQLNGVDAPHIAQNTEF